MDKNVLWSLRLGFSSKQAKAIEQLGLEKFLSLSYVSIVEKKIPEILSDSPKTFSEFKEIRKKLKDNPDETKKALLKDLKNSLELKEWWLQKITKEEFPLREKMTCFWHNHFVSSFQKVKVNYWIYQHNQILRENAFGNFKTLTKQIIKTNAMVRYLDNVENRKEKLNENLSRELLELFTLGIGNYTETDIKNGAKGLAGLTLGEENATYKKFFEDNEPFTYFGKKGSFKIDEMIDIIFEQPNIPYLIVRKILKWFIYDNPNEKLVQYYGNYFKKMNFEIQPLLTKIFTEESLKNNEGSKIKNPLEYILQLTHELNLENNNLKLTAIFLKEQGMDLFNQPNVKGWDGGNSWLTSQLFLQRNNIVDLLCSGKNLRKYENENDSMMSNKQVNKLQRVQINWKKEGNNKDIIAELSNRLLFQVDKSNQEDFEQILKYDFDNKTEGAEFAVMRLFQFMIKTPEYQLI